jgi:hypothetical protein
MRETGCWIAFRSSLKCCAKHKIDTKTRMRVDAIFLTQRHKGSKAQSYFKTKMLIIGTYFQRIEPIELKHQTPNNNY